MTAVDLLHSAVPRLDRASYRLWAAGLARVPVRLGSGWTDNPHRRLPVMVLAPP